MPPPRAARSRPAKAESDSDDDTERETTPKPISSGLRRRFSERPQNGQDDEDAGGKRASGPAVTVNDDAAEKRRRRKSARMTALPADEEEQPAAGPSNASAGPTGNGPVRTSGRGLQRLESVAHIEEPINVPRDVMSSNFEEWMKMATDNKINAANSWNFALIDYFHDMSLLRNPDDNTINFQRASCTVDACVKIWTSRVDSVGTETGRLLSNLAQERGLEEEADGSDEEGGEGGESQTRTRKKRAQANTLAKDPAQLKNKKPDLEFSVDPLFKKTCADFDEGGAQGLLMSHLNLGVSQGGGLRMVFDASDAPPRRTEEEEQELEEPVDEIDIGALRGEFFPDLDVLEDKAISHSLSQFTFGKDAFFDEKTFPGAAIGALDSDDEDFGAPPQMTGDGDVPMEMGPDGEAFAPPPEDFFSGDQAIDDFGGGGDDFAGRDDDDEQGSVGATGGQYMAGSGGPGLLPFDPTRPTQQQYVMALAEGDDNMLNYFDQGFVKNWAGPEHWKLRRPIARKDGDGAAKPKREKKEAFKVDFTTPSEKTWKETSKELFAPVTRGAGISLPGRSRKRKTKAQREKDETREKDLHLLPDDMHFSSRELVTLFLKPEFQLKMRGKALQEASADQEIDADYWAKAAERAAEANAEPDDSQMPFATQFFNDDDDDGPGFDGFDSGGLADGVIPPADEEQDLLAGSQGPKRKVKPEFVNYAKRAKRVDVRRLKENIWKGLDIIVPMPKAEEDMDEDDPKEDEGTDPTSAREFGDVVSGLRSMYPREKMEEISTSFCFICLLHLANERGLKLEVGADGTLDGDNDMGMGPDKRVGELASLNVYRDARAIPAA